MNNRRNLVIALGAVALTPPFGSFGQQQAKVPRIGFLGATSAADYEKEMGAMQAGLRELGYTVGQNIVFESRWAEGKYEQLPALAAELVRLKVELIVTRGTPATRAAQAATTTIPIIMVGVGDPVGGGFVQSLAHPGGNITGFTPTAGEISAKLLEMLQSMVPKLSRVAALMNSDNSIHARFLQTVQAAAQRTNSKLLPVQVRAAPEIEKAFLTMTRDKAGAVMVPRDALFIQQARKIAELAVKNRLLSIAAFEEFVEAGGLMSYGSSGADRFRRAAIYVDKILKGAKPAFLPVEQPTKFELVINGKTAKALGLTIPQSLLISADKVIE